MPLSRSEVQELYTKGIDRYNSFIRFFRSPQAIQALLKGSRLIRPGLRVLDAGCGFGMVTFALLDVLRQKNFDYRGVDAFDLTPAMLARFQQTLEACASTRVPLRQADVLALDTLPASWTDYDLIRQLPCSNTSRSGISLAPWTGCARAWRPTGTCWS